MAEMSGWFLPHGRELTAVELAEHRRRGLIERSDRRFKYCRKSLLWLQNALGLGTSFGLANMLRQMEINGSAMFYYEPRLVEKPEGGTRVIIPPKRQLQLVQRRVHLLLAKTFPRPLHAFGYRGGSCFDLAQRHREFRSTLKFDVKAAFFQVGYARVRTAIRGYQCYVGKPGLFKRLPGFSSSVAQWIARLCTYTPVSDEVAARLPFRARSFLPQGAPTSPICFDLACAQLDRRLLKIAKRVGGLMSRYADNYYFSMPAPEISPKLEAMIVCSTRKRYGFPIHKLRNVKEGELRRILGYNLVGNQMRNTRRFLRNFRGALYVLQTRLDRGLEWQDAYLRVKGFMSFAEEIPGNLQQVYEYCESKIASL